MHVTLWMPWADSYHCWYRPGCFSLWQVMHLPATEASSGSCAVAPVARRAKAHRAIRQARIMVRTSLRRTWTGSYGRAHTERAGLRCLRTGNDGISEKGFPRSGGHATACHGAGMVDVRTPDREPRWGSTADETRSSSGTEDGAPIRRTGVAHRASWRTRRSMSGSPMPSLRRRRAARARATVHRRWERRRPRGQVNASAARRAMQMLSYFCDAPVSALAVPWTALVHLIPFHHELARTSF